MSPDVASLLLAWRDAYLASGSPSRASRDAFLALAGGLSVTRTRGHLLVKDATGRVVGVHLTWTPDPEEAPLSTVPCATCGALPVGTTYGSGTRGDEQRRYNCGPHEPVDELVLAARDIFADVLVDDENDRYARDGGRGHA